MRTFILPAVLITIGCTSGVPPVGLRTTIVSTLGPGHFIVKDAYGFMQGTLEQADKLTMSWAKHQCDDVEAIVIKEWSDKNYYYREIKCDGKHAESAIN
jgi:hypothetical protein